MLSRSMNATSRLKKRERTQNWAFEEKRYLLELCKRDMNIIENKRLDADLTALKNRAWKSVHEEFCKVFGNERNCNRLKEQWRRMKGTIYVLFFFFCFVFEEGRTKINTIRLLSEWPWHCRSSDVDYV